MFDFVNCRVLRSEEGESVCDEEGFKEQLQVGFA